MNTYSKNKFRLCVCLIILNVLFIWGNSILPGDTSAAISKWVRSFLSSIVPGHTDSSEVGHGILRKLAHFAEFCTLGFLLNWLFSMQKKPVWLPIIHGFLAGCTDEIIQCFVPERGPAVFDVAIDTAGVAVGVAVFMLLLTVMNKRINFLEDKSL